MMELTRKTTTADSSIGLRPQLEGVSRRNLAVNKFGQTYMSLNLAHILYQISNVSLLSSQISNTRKLYY
jgi:hypothetical protein